MDRLRGLAARLRSLVRRDAAERDLDDEIRFHLEMEAQKNRARGMSPAEARRRAVLAFGGVEKHREAVRDGRRLGWIEDLGRDLAYSLRTFRHAPGFALAAVLTLGLAIGAGSVVFSLVNALVLRPFPVPDPGRLVALWSVDPREGGSAGISFAEYLDWRDESGVFSGLAAQAARPLSLEADGPADLVWSEVVSEDYFAVLGLRPALGRFFLPGEEAAPGANPYVVLSHHLWRERFGADPAVVGRRVRVNGHPFEVIGVAPESFHGLRRLGFWPDVWVPLGMHAVVLPERGDLRSDRDDRWLLAVGRLRPGLERERAEALASAFARRLEDAFPATNREVGALLTSARAPFDPPRFVPPQVLVLASSLGLVAVALVLLVACGNLAGLMLARASARRREIAVRLALGGSRGRLVRQLLTESAVLAAAGGALGLLLAAFASRFEGALLPRLQFRVGLAAAMDHRVVLFTAGVAFAALFLFGLAPALRATRLELLPALRGRAPAGGARRRELRDLLVVGQIAASVVLLIAGGLFLRSLGASRTVELGFDPEDRLLLSVDPGVRGYDAARKIAFFREADRRVEALPGVVSASWGFPVPFDTHGEGTELFVPGAEGEGPRQTVEVAMSTVEPGYFEALGSRLVAGRDLAEGDSAGAPSVMVVNRTMAERFWPGGEAVGRRVRLGGADGPEVEVVGVVEDAAHQSPTEARRPYLFLPLRQNGAGAMTLVIHVRGSAEALLPAVREEIRALDPALPTYGGVTLERSLRNALSPQETAALLAGLLGALALALALVGLYGVVAYGVARRTRELGIRIALGASPREVLRAVLRGAGRTTLAGVALGLVGALLVGRVMGSLLFGVSPSDPLVFLAVPVLLSAVALLASLLPARRATRVDPLVALRAE
jgi:predicted permease